MAIGGIETGGKDRDEPRRGGGGLALADAGTPGGADGAARRSIEFRLTSNPVPLRSLVASLWRSRDLLLVLGRKEFYVRYRRASFGLLWAVCIPLVQAIVIAVVIRRVAHFSFGPSYPLAVYAGNLVWNFFSIGILASAASIVDNSEISTRIYFPRSIFPMMTVVAGVYGFLMTVVVLLGFEVVVGVTPGPSNLWLVPGAALAIVVTSALGLVLAGLQVYFRDTKFVFQAILIPWFYLTPIFYPMSVLGRFKLLVLLNPVTGIVEMFRAAIGAADPGWVATVWSSLGWSIVLLAAAAALYRRFDRVFADLL